MIKNQQLVLWILMSTALVVSLAQPAYAQSLDKDKVRKVQAAYLYNFAKFIQWPKGSFERADSPFVIAVLGEKSFGRLLSTTVRSKTISGHPIKVTLIQSSKDSIRKALENSHILYIDCEEQQWISNIMVTSSKLPVLVVSDAMGFARTGGMIGFAYEKGRIVFEINRTSLDRAKLNASSKLMKLARIVKTTK